MYTQNGNINVSTFTWTDHTKSNNFSVSHQFKICFVKSGNLIWEIDGKNYDVGAGDIVLLNNSEQRRFKKIYDNAMFELFIIEFEPRLLFASAFLHLFLHRDGAFCHVIHTNDTLIPSIISDIEQENELRAPYCEEVIISKICTLLALVARISKLSYSRISHMSKQMYDVHDYIAQHYTDGITLGELAQVAHMSPSGFSKAFLRCNGIGVMQYIIRKRVTKAIYMLENTDESVLEIAFECGFNNGASFYQAFKSITERTPKSYRK